MISDAHRYYGCVLAAIAELPLQPISIKRISESLAGFYLLNKTLPIFVKYSRSRKGPWTFNFMLEHQQFQEDLYNIYGECLVIFVCGRDGIAAMKHKLFRNVLDNVFDKQEAVKIRRKHNEMYKIHGKDGSLKNKLSRNSLSELMLDFYSNVEIR